MRRPMELGAVAMTTTECILEPWVEEVAVGVMDICHGIIITGKENIIEAGTKFFELIEIILPGRTLRILTCKRSLV